MYVNDPIADMLTRIRNANSIKSSSVVIPTSKLKIEILKVLTKEGFIANFEVKDELINVNLKYTDGKKVRVIRGLKRISKPGLRTYAKVNQIPKILNNLGVVILSTSAGILTDKEAKLKKLGGEVLAFVW